MNDQIACHIEASSELYPFNDRIESLHSAKGTNTY